MTPREVFDEWMKGCTCTNCPPNGSQLPPWKCDECTEAMMRALGTAFERERTAEAKFMAYGEGNPAPPDLIAAMRPAIEARLDDALRDELATSTRDKDNAETANHGLRVELHMAQQLLAGANASIQLLARGAGQAKSAHLLEMAELTQQYAEALAELDDIRRTVEHLKRELAR